MRSIPSKPAPPGYITAAGHRLLQQELQALWVRRREVVKALAAAAAEGDRSENAEYIYRKKELREIDRRIRYLQKRLPELKVVDGLPSDPRRVYFGAWVTVENEEGEVATWRIVGADEFHRDRRYISLDAPLARALLGKGLDEEVRVELPRGRTTLLVTAIHYGDAPDE